MLLSVDGGATKTVAIIVDEKEGTIKGIGISGPSNFVSAGPEMAEKNLKSAVFNALGGASETLDSVESGIFGIAGIGDSNTDTNVGVKIIDKITNRPDFIKINDGEPAYRLANLNEEGIVFAGGTGSVCFYLLNNKLNRLGGWGWFIGDDGSASWIAKRALNIATKEFDNIIEEKYMIETSERYFHKNFRDVISELEQKHDKTNVAGFAPYVSEMASKNNRIALNIFNDSAEYISSIVNSIKRHFSKNPRISLVGGTVLAGQFYKDLLSKKLGSGIYMYPGYQVAIGGVLVLMEKLGIPINFKMRDDMVLQIEGLINGARKEEYKKFLRTLS